MNSQTSLVAEQCRIQTWAMQIKDCQNRPKNMTVDEWCLQNNMSMVEHFFSLKFADRNDLFEGKNIWKDEKYRSLQGTYPVISLSFANVKEKTYEDIRSKICQLLVRLYSQYEFLLQTDILTEAEKDLFQRVAVDMSDVDATLALYQLCDYLCRYYGKKVIILLDEYDTPM